MPLRQSTLSFGTLATSIIGRPSMMSMEPSVNVERSSSTDTDTIVVDISSMNTQLPTPVDSATDASSQSSQGDVSRRVPKSRSKRVFSSTEKKRVFQENITTTHVVEQDKNRSISGETLIPEEGTTAKADESNEKLQTPDIPHDLNDAAVNKHDNDSVEERNEDQETSSVITVEEESEDDTLREERRALKVAKMEANAKKWEQRKKIAEQSATRRSGRASLISKAGVMLDNIKETILGKGSRKTRGKEDSSQPISKPSQSSDSLTAGQKRKRVEDDAVVEEPKAKKTTVRREKKWLISGLYAGQQRLFDARFTENKNRHKSKALQDTDIKENTVMPLPMFAGERLLQHGRDFKLPFDIFSPLPAGQPKPDEWKKVNKNVFVGDAAEQWRTNKFAEHSMCTCDFRVGCDQDCMNRYMYYECDQYNCSREIDECGNRAFDKLKKRAKLGGKYNIGVEVMRTEDRGYGVRSNRTFMPNQIIVEYTGEIITQEECEQRMRTIYKNNECYYLMLFDQNMIIDATRGSIARFVNHSCEPNCRMEKWTVHGEPRMALFAGDRGIMTGEELTYDYNFDPYSQKNVQACRCGAEKCRGVLGPTPKPDAKRPTPENETGRKKDKKSSGAKRKIATVLKESTNRGSIKKKATLPVKAISGKKSAKRTISVKRVTSRKVSVPKDTIKLARSDSKLKKLVTGVKSKAGSLKAQRVNSTASSRTTLPGKTSLPVARSSSLKEKAKNMTKTVRARAKTITAGA